MICLVDKYRVAGFAWPANQKLGLQRSRPKQWQAIWAKSALWAFTFESPRTSDDQSKNPSLQMGFYFGEPTVVGFEHLLASLERMGKRLEELGVDGYILGSS